MPADDSLRETLDGHLSQLAEDTTGAKQRIRELISGAVGMPKESVAVSVARGGTKQTRNRLGQAEVQRASQLTIFLLAETDQPEACVRYVMDALRGRNDAKPPVGPVAFVTPRTSGPMLVSLVEGRETQASALLRGIYGITSANPFDALDPQLPSDASLWLLMSSGQSTYGDRDGVRYHFPMSIPNGQRLAAGDIVAIARTKGSVQPDAGSVFGLGRVGRRVNAEENRSSYAYFDRYLKVDPAIPLTELSDPRTNVNSIVALDQAWVLNLMHKVGVESIADLPTPITALSLDTLKVQVRQDGLIFQDSLVASLLVAIRSGKHVMLTGAPGTGKTSLAMTLASAAAATGLCNEPLLTTGTADWTSADTVGAYRLTKDQQLRFHAGHVLLALEQNRWLIIDELNRADIDKAIGQLFTALSGQAVTLPFEEHDEQIDSDVPISVVPPGQSPPIGTTPKRIHENWRVIATLNDRDRDLLFDMSEALLRRFAVVEVPTPSPKLWREILALTGGTGRADWDVALERLVELPELAVRPVGAAVLLDAVRHLREVVYLQDETGVSLNAVAALQEALDLYVAPQLRTLRDSVSLDASDLLGNVAEPASAQDPGNS